MKGDPQVIEYLNECLTAEITSVNQYWIHARMLHNWGYMRLWKKIREESIGEMKHADMLIERILFLEGVPNLQRYNKVDVGETVREQFRIDLNNERTHRDRLVKGVELCLQKSDMQSRRILEVILEETEEHVDWLEAQHDLIEQIGYENYLAQQIHDPNGADA